MPLVPTSMLTLPSATSKISNRERCLSLMGVAAVRGLRSAHSACGTYARSKAVGA